MKNYKRVRKMAALLVSVMLVDTFAGAVSPYIKDRKSVV